MNIASKKTRSLLLALVAIGLLAGCSKTDSTDTTASTSGSTPGQFIDDTAITAKVKAALAGDSAIKSSEISVTTNQGVVTLSGSVDTSDQKSAAAKDAAAVSGVKDVTNTLNTK